MNLMKELTEDHKDIRSQLRALMTESEKEKMKETIVTLNEFVSHHAFWVNDVLRKLVKTKSVDQFTADIMESREDIQVIEDLFSKVKNIKKSDEGWFADIKALCSMLELHLEDEEEFFPKIKPLLPG